MIITIEGNIGAGKSSFAKSLCDSMKSVGREVVHIQEPIDAWTDFQGVNLLGLMYADPPRWAFTFQINALLYMSDCDKKALDYANKGYTVVRERSLFSTRNIFVPLVAKGMTAQERRILEDLCDRMSDPCRPCPTCRASDITVYLRTDPEVCYQRVKKRARPEELEGRVDLAYLIQLHEVHEQAMNKIRQSGSRLVVADGDDFDVGDPQSLKLLGCDCCILNTINGVKCLKHPAEKSSTDSSNSP